MASDYATHVEQLPVERRYQFIKGLDVEEMRRLVLSNLVCRLRKAQRRKVAHKDLAYFLYVIKSEKDLDKIRQLVCGAKVHLTALECNQ